MTPCRHLTRVFRRPKTSEACKGASRSTRILAFESEPIWHDCESISQDCLTSPLGSSRSTRPNIWVAVECTCDSVLAFDLVLLGVTIASNQSLPSGASASCFALRRTAVVACDYGILPHPLTAVLHTLYRPVREENPSKVEIFSRMVKRGGYLLRQWTFFMRTGHKNAVSVQYS